MLNDVASRPDRLRDNALQLRVIRRAMSTGYVPIMLWHTSQYTHLRGVAEPPVLVYGEGKRGVGTAAMGRGALQGFKRDGWGRLVEV